MSQELHHHFLQQNSTMLSYKTLQISLCTPQPTTHHETSEHHLVGPWQRHRGSRLEFFFSCNPSIIIRSVAWVACKYNINSAFLSLVCIKYRVNSTSDSCAKVKFVPYGVCKRLSNWSSDCDWMTCCWGRPKNSALQARVARWRAACNHQRHSRDPLN